jgi:hypothetical protein
VVNDLCHQPGSHYWAWFGSFANMAQLPSGSEFSDSGAVRQSNCAATGVTKTKILSHLVGRLGQFVACCAFSFGLLLG